jgi:hypothetical protein
VRGQRIEDEEACHAPQIKHPPRTPTIVRDVGACHVAGDQNSVGIMRAYGGIEHSTAAARPEDAKTSGPRCRTRNAAGKCQSYNYAKKCRVHFLFPNLFTIAGRLDFYFHPEELNVSERKSFQFRIE